MIDSSLIKFINNDDFSKDSINAFVSSRNTTTSRLIKSLFKLSYDIEYPLDKECLEKVIKLISSIFSYTTFEDEEIINNKLRLSKLKERLIQSAETDDYYNGLLAIVNSIIVDKKINIPEVKKLIKELIDRKETFYIIKELIEMDKNIASDLELFNYVFNKLISCDKTNDYTVNYYIELLRICYSKNMNSKDYLDRLSKDGLSELAFSELYNIITGRKYSLNGREVERKFDTDQKLLTSPISKPKFGTGLAQGIFTIDSSTLNIKDDGLSIRKDGNKYIVGIHVCDVGYPIVYDSLLDVQARNIVKEVYLNDRKVELFPMKVKRALSLDEREKKGVISLYVVLSEYGDIIDYSLVNEPVHIYSNFTYAGANKMIQERRPNKFEHDIQQLYRLALCLKRNSNREKDFSGGENSAHNITDTKSFMLVSEFMILYNSILPQIAHEKSIPYIYRGKNPSYIPELLEEKHIDLDPTSKQKATSFFLESYYSAIPVKHSSLNCNYYSTSSGPLRKYTALYNQHLLHKFLFENKDMNFSYEEFVAMVDYLNERTEEMNLFKDSYAKRLRK